jgi:hypothetical protein
LDNSDNMSMISFSQRSMTNLNADGDFNRLSVPASTRSRKSNSADSVAGNSS